MSKLSQSIRSTVRQGNSISAIVRDVNGTLATVQLASNGAVYHNLYVTGGPVNVGQKVILDYTTNPPTIIAPGKDYSGLLESIVKDIDLIKKILSATRAKSSTAVTADNFGWSFIIPTSGSGNVSGYVEVPYNCEIKEVTIVGDVSGSCVVDIWCDTYINFPPTDDDSITASTPPTLSSGQTNKDTDLVDWTTTLSAGSWLAFKIDSVSTISQITIAIKGTIT